MESTVIKVLMCYLLDWFKCVEVVFTYIQFLGWRTSDFIMSPLQIQTYAARLQICSGCIFLQHIPSLSGLQYN